MPTNPEQSRPAVRRPSRVPARFAPDEVVDGAVSVDAVMAAESLHARKPRRIVEPTSVPASAETEPAAKQSTEVPSPAPHDSPAPMSRPTPPPARPAPQQPPVPPTRPAQPAPAQAPPRKKAKRRRSRQRTPGQIVWLVVRRTLIVLLTVVLLLVVGVLALCYTIVNGPSPTIRNQLVLTAMQTSAMQWAPGLFMSDEEVQRIVDDSHVVRQEEIDLSDFAPAVKVDAAGQPVDPWENAIDGMLYEQISGPTFKGYVLLVKDPSRVYVSTSSDFKSGLPGMQIFTGVDRDGAVAAINGGEFWDTGGGGDGGKPMGLTYSRGQMVYQDWSTRTFIGITNEHKLVVAEKMTVAEANALGIRDAVSFQNGNTLITHEGDKVTLHYNDDNTGKAQRTAIGQRADGTIIMVVTDGRTAASLGATHNDIIDVMAGYGAVTAGMLDGGSSAMMYYRDWYEKYDVDVSTLDENQRKGMVNKFKAFTPPRYIPTYFMVAAEEAAS